MTKEEFTKIFVECDRNVKQLTNKMPIYDLYCCYCNGKYDSKTNIKFNNFYDGSFYFKKKKLDYKFENIVWLGRLSVVDKHIKVFLYDLKFKEVEE